MGTEVLSPGVNRLERESEHSHPSRERVKLYLHSPIGLQGTMLKHKGKFKCLLEYLMCNETFLWDVMKSQFDMHECYTVICTQLDKVRVKLFLCFKNTPRHVEIWGSGGIIPSIPNLSTRRKWSASCPGCFTPGKEPPEPIESRIQLGQYLK
jgi:hypothetical protein